MFGPIIAIAEGAIMGAMSAWPTAHTATTAKHRLRWVVKADREVVPAWRWVPTFLYSTAEVRGGEVVKRTYTRDGILWGSKPTYRMERRA
jgi:hypothetical protein